MRALVTHELHLRRAEAPREEDFLAVLLVSERIISDASIALGGMVLPGMPAAQRLDTLLSGLPEGKECGVDRALGDGGDDVELPTVRVLDELLGDNAPANAALVAAGFLVFAGAVVLAEAISRWAIRLIGPSWASDVTRSRFVFVVVEDAVMVRSPDEDEVVLKKVANERGPEADHDLLFECLTTEERKMLAITGG